MAFNYSDRLSDKFNFTVEGIIVETLVGDIISEHNYREIFCIWVFVLHNYSNIMFLLHEAT